MYVPRDTALFSSPPTLDGPPSIIIDEVDLRAVDLLRTLNTAIFNERRIINTFDRPDLMILLAWVDDIPAGFKIGYRENRFTFYSAKGGVLARFRRQGLARLMLHDMMVRVKTNGFTRFAYDTFPNMHPGMTVLGLAEGFRVMKADFNPTYKDYRLRLEKKL